LVDLRVQLGEVLRSGCYAPVGEIVLQGSHCLGDLERMKSNLNMIQLNKILKNLETKKLIKAVKSVNVGYAMLHPLYPISNTE